MLGFHLEINKSFTLFVSSSGFKEVSADRGMTNIVVTYDLLKEFIYYFINNCF